MSVERQSPSAAQPAPQAAEKLTDDRLLCVARDQRRELADFLLDHAEEITATWSRRASDDPVFAPPQVATERGETQAPSLLALVEHLEAAGPDVHLPAHGAWLARWHEAGTGRANVRDHFHALRDVAIHALQMTDRIPEAEKAALVSLLEAAVRNLRLETSEVETRHLLAEAVEARRQFEGLFENAVDAIIIGEIEQETVLAANPAAAALLEMPREQMQASKLGDLQPELPAFVHQQVSEENPDLRKPQLLPLRTANGLVRVIEVNAAPVEYYGQHAVQMFLRDVTERVRFNEELQRRAEQLQSQLSGQLQAVQHLQVFLDNVINALPARLLVLDENLRILHANSAYLRQRRLAQEEVEGEHISTVFPAALLEDAGLRQAMENTLRTGDRVRWAGFRQATEDHAERILNIGLDPCPGVSGERNLLVTIEDVTERHRQLYERSILHQIVQAMLGMRDLPRLLHAILTGITAGGAVGLGFNRALLMLADDHRGLLQAEMAVGPENAAHAGQIWSQLAEHRTLSEFLTAFDNLPPPEEQPLRSIVERLSFPLSDTSILPMLAAANRETVYVMDASNDPRVPPELHAVLGADEFVVAPMVVQDKVIGVAIADNSINHQRISQTDVQLLTALANHAALAIDSARVYAQEQRRADELDEAYRKLEAATERMVRSEALAAIGEVTAIVAHEIRNPLSTIGGFGKMLQRSADNVDIVRRNAGIIVEEVAKLESILGELLDFTRPARLHFATCSFREVVEDSLQAVQQRAAARKAEIVLDVPEDLPTVAMDCGQMQQVISNLIINAVDAIPEGGKVVINGRHVDDSVKLSVTDNGQGIPASHLDQIFDTFFTTKPTGTGLGLALAKKVIEDHGATLSVASQEGIGTTFTITFEAEENLPSAELPGESASAEPQGAADTKGVARDGQADNTGN
ncbi:MAG: ATP-binding protein [Armatimonadota bacterium]